MIQTTRYGMRVEIPVDYDQAVEQTTVALKAEGFGVLTTIDVKATLKAKLDKDFRRYIILGACNPPLAHKALSSDLDVGLLLPCNVVVYQEGEGSVVKAMDPEAALGIVPVEALKPIAAEAKARLERALSKLAK